MTFNVCMWYIFRRWTRAFSKLSTLTALIYVRSNGNLRPERCTVETWTEVSQFCDTITVHVLSRVENTERKKAVTEPRRLNASCTYKAAKLNVCRGKIAVGSSGHRHLSSPVNVTNDVSINPLVTSSCNGRKSNIDIHWTQSSLQKEKKIKQIQAPKSSNFPTPSRLLVSKCSWMFVLLIYIYANLNTSFA